MCAPRVTRHTSIRYWSSSAVNGLPLDFCLHRNPVSVNCLYHARMVLSVDGSFAYFARNALCTVTTDLLAWYSNTQNYFSPGDAIFSLHKLASPSGRNVKYDEKQLTGGGELNYSFYLYRFRKHVSYGFLEQIFVIPEYIMKRPVYYFQMRYLQSQKYGQRTPLYNHIIQSHSKCCKSIFNLLSPKFCCQFKWWKLYRFFSRVNDFGFFFHFCIKFKDAFSVTGDDNENILMCWHFNFPSAF